MTNKMLEMIIDDYKKTVERLQKENSEITDINIKLFSTIKTLEEYKVSKQTSYEAIQKQNNSLELENRKLKKKIEVAENFLDAIAHGFHFSDDIEEHLRNLAKQGILNMRNTDGTCN